MTIDRAGQMAETDAGTPERDWLLAAIEHADLLEGHFGEYCHRITLSATSSNPIPMAASCALGPQPESARGARAFTRTTLANWGLGQLIDDVGLVVSELVTNALRHALAADRPAGRLVRLSLLCRGSHAMCAVADPSSNIPVRREPDWVAETGRGLYLVESFSRAWGWTPLNEQGKCVWALFVSRAVAGTPAEPAW